MVKPTRPTDPVTLRMYDLHINGVPELPDNKPWSLDRIGQAYDISRQAVHKRFQNADLKCRSRGMSPAQKKKIRDLDCQGYTAKYIANNMGLSTTTVTKWIRESAK